MVDNEKRTVSCYTESGRFIDIPRHIFADMLTAYTNRLFDRRSAEQAKLAKLDLESSSFEAELVNIRFEFNDATWRLDVCDKIDKAFKET